MDPNSVNFEQQLNELVRQELEKQNQNKEGAEKPLKLNIGQQEYTFKDTSELSTQLTAVLGNYQQQLAAMQQQLQNGQPGSYVTDDETPAQTPAPKLDMKKYIEYLENDPVKAAEYVDSYRYFDGRVENPSEIIRERLARSAENERILAAYQFKDSHPEFPGGQQPTMVINKLREELNLPFTAEGLEAAYGVAINRGFLPNYKMIQMQQQMQMQQQQQMQQNGQQAPNPYAPPPNNYNAMQRFAPPVVPQSGSVSSGGFNPEDLSLDQLESILRKADGRG